MRGGRFVVGFAALGMLVAAAALWLKPLLVDPAWVVAITALGRNEA